MKNIDLKYICTTIGNLSGIPIRLFCGEEQTFYYSLIDLPKDPICIYEKEIFSITSHVGYFIAPDFDYYGIVNSGLNKIVIGPTRLTPKTSQELKELAFRADVPPRETDDFVRAMKDIISMPLDSLLQMLCTINYLLNEEKLGLENIYIYETEQLDIKSALENQKMQQNLDASQEQEASQQEIHNTLAMEQALMNLVRQGDSAALKEWMASAPAIRPGILAADQLRQHKNTFIVSATLVSRAAIQGGMDVNDALSLSDAFIQKCELLNTLDRIANLQYHMVLDFTERVERLRFGKRPTRLVLEVSNYIQHHLSDAITAEDIAAHLYMSRPYLSARFRQETGETLTDFILKEKTEEAKRLLRYTDKSLSAISSYLGFSSQSHFSRVFKKYAGCTPSQYRSS